MPTALLLPAAAPPGSAGPARDEPLLLTDLLVPFARLRALAVQEAGRAHWADAFLLAAAAAQILDDHLHHSKSWPKRILEQVGHHPRPLLERAAGVGRAGLDLVGAARSRRPVHRDLVARRADLLEITVDLAASTLGAVPMDSEALVERVRTVLADGPHWPDALEATVLTVPSGLRSFDQHPRDLVALAGVVAAARPDRNGPLAVFGIRTSGSYLGPLLAAALRGEGFTDVTLGAIRPDDHLDAGQRALVRRVREGAALVVDDPPVSGDSIAECMALLVGAGLDPDRVMATLALDDPAGLDLPALAGRPRIVLPVEDWYLPGLLGAEVVRPTLQRFLGGTVTVGEPQPVPWPGPAAPEAASTAHRHHRRAAFAVDLVAADGEPRTRTLLVESCGQGFFGRHSVAVAGRLPGRTPESVGFAAGLHYQWLPDGWSPLTPDDLEAEAVVDHLVARHEALAVDHDPSIAFVGRQSVVEVATEVLAGVLGPLAHPARLAVVDPAVRRLLTVARPSVIDGRVTPDRFLAGPGDAPLVKVDAAEGAFSHRDLACYDPVLDVAQLAETPIGAEVRAGWEARTGHAVAPARWLLYRLVHRWDRCRHRELGDEAARRITARALQDHLAEVVLLGGRPAVATGPWVGLDVDGVLEGPVLDASAPGRTGALALAALLRHGHRVVLATGRSVGDVTDRVRAWDLAGGVAEYGAALVVPTDAGPVRVVDLRSAEDRDRMTEVRAVLGAMGDVATDPDHGHTVRAYRLDARGARIGLTDEQVAALRSALVDPEAVTVVPGEAQTDITPRGCTKATGITALLALLGGEGPLALAVGDGPADRGMLDLAERRYLPRHARALARDGDTVAPGAYQAGLADAVGDLLGHCPGGCPTCAVDLDADTRFVLAVLSLREAGPRGLPRRLAEVVATAGPAGRRR